MKCCNKQNIVSIMGKCNDLFNAEGFNYPDYEGYVPYDLNIGGGDYIYFTYCLNCGQIINEAFNEK